MASDAAGSRRSNRARSSPRPPAVTAATKRSAGGGASAAATGPLSKAALAIPTRPRPSELQRAVRVIARMKAAGIIKNRGPPPKPNVVACALALQLNEAFTDDKAAKRLFNVGAKTNVRGEWVDGCTVHGVWVDAKLKRLAAHENAARGAPVPPLYPRTRRARPQPLTDPSPVPHQSALRSGCSNGSAREIGRTSCVQSGWPHERWRVRASTYSRSCSGLKCVKREFAASLCRKCHLQR